VWKSSFDPLLIRHMSILFKLSTAIKIAPKCGNIDDDVHSHLIVSHTLKPSRGLVPLVDAPARPTIVGSQSETWMSPRLTLPGCSIIGPVTKPTPLTPPSQSVHFLPRRGQLFPPVRVWPPLSAQHRGNSTTLWTDHNTYLIMTLAYTAKNAFITFLTK